MSMHLSLNVTVGWFIQLFVGKVVMSYRSHPSFEFIKLTQKSGRSLTTPLKLKMIIPLIVGAIGDNPGIPHAMLWEILKPYANDYALMDSILQEG